MSSGHFCWWLLNPWSDTCFIDMESTAAWLQALGSAIAILFTVYLYKDQIKQANKFKSAEADEIRSKQLLRLKHFSLQMQSAFGHLKKILGSKPILHNFRSIKTLVDENLLWSRDYEVNYISEEELAFFLALRIKAHGISMWLGEYLDKGDSVPGGLDYPIAVIDSAKSELDFYANIV